MSDKGEVRRNFVEQTQKKLKKGREIEGEQMVSGYHRLWIAAVWVLPCSIQGEDALDSDNQTHIAQFPWESYASVCASTIYTSVTIFFNTFHSEFLVSINYKWK